MNESPTVVTGTQTESAHEPRAGAGTAAVVYNPIKVDRETLEDAIAAEDATAAWSETLWFETTEDDPGQGVTQQAVDQQVDMVIAAGGDGTVRAVAEALRGTGIPLALLPSGTGNLLARNLDLTLNDLEHSIHSAFTGKNRKIDLGVIDILRDDKSRDRHVFLVMAGLGIDAKMLANTDPELKKKVGWLAYVDAIVKALRDKSELRVRYSVDGAPTRRRNVHTLIVGNCGSLPANILLLPEAAVDDGIFDIVFLRPKDLLGWLQIWGKIAWENGVVRRTRAGRKLMGPVKPVRALEYMTGKTLIVRLDKPEEIELDGDGFGRATALKTWAEAGALTIRVPGDS
ncbi:MAG TPA: diacylglycerol kinase family protein [Glaciibacter sp.]|nr:diacylglycerol kinase family protein [Glaciibacter sp.]